jgi:hypothetical protein
MGPTLASLAGKITLAARLMICYNTSNSGGIFMSTIHLIRVANKHAERIEGPQLCDMVGAVTDPAYLPLVARDVIHRIHMLIQLEDGSPVLESDEHGMFVEVYYQDDLRPGLWKPCILFFAKEETEVDVFDPTGCTEPEIDKEEELINDLEDWFNRADDDHIN